MSLKLARRRGWKRQAPSGSPAIGAAIRGARERAGMSQRRLAAAAGVTQTCIQHWEGAKRMPGTEGLARLERVLGPVQEVALAA